MSTASGPALVAALFLCAAGPLAAQEPMTLEDAIAHARGFNPEYRVAVGEEVLADWDVRAAVGGLFPTASFSSGLSWQGSGEQRIGGLTAGQLGVGAQPSFLFSSYSLGVNYTLTGASLRAPSRARAARTQTRARIQGAGSDLALAVTRAYLDLQRQSELVGLVRLERERAEANLRLARGQEAVGTATALDVRQAEVQVGRAEVAILQAEQAVVTARLGLLQQMGVDTDREVDPVTRFAVTPVPWTEQELVAAAHEHNPGLAALRAGEDVADVDVAQARSAYYPSLSLQAGLSGFTRRAGDDEFFLAQVEAQTQQFIRQCEFQNELFRRLAEPLPEQDCDEFFLTPEQRQAALDANRNFPLDFTRQPAQLSLTVSVPIFQGLERQRALEAARIQRSSARERARERELALRVEASRLVSAARTAYRTVELEERNRELAESQLRLARAQFELGDVSFLELVEAEAVRAQADREYLEAVFRYHETRAEMEALVGGSLPGG